MGDCPPTPVGISPVQELLLTVILADEESALAAWEKVRSRFSVDSLEPGSFQVMPMLAERLLALDLGHPDLPRLRGMRRQASWRARLAAHDAAAFVSAVQRAPAAHLAWDGPPLSSLLYGESWRRPITGLEVVVPAESLRSVVESLAGDGWVPMRRRFARLRSRGVHAVRWRSPSGLPCAVRPDLPEDLLGEPGLVRDNVWRGSTQTDLDEVTIDVPAPVDVLSHVTLARKRAAPDRRCLWLADAARALQHPALDGAELQRRLDMSGPDDSLPTALRLLARAGVRVGEMHSRGSAR